MSRGSWILVGSVAALAALASTLASTSPDGLERVSRELGFAKQEQTLYRAPLADYHLPALGSLSGAGAGLVGTLVVGVLAWGAGRLLVRPHQP